MDIRWCISFLLYRKRTDRPVRCTTFRPKFEKIVPANENRRDYRQGARYNNGNNNIPSKCTQYIISLVIHNDWNYFIHTYIYKRAVYIYVIITITRDNNHIIYIIFFDQKVHSYLFLSTIARYSFYFISPIIILFHY